MDVTVPAGPGRSPTGVMRSFKAWRSDTEAELGNQPPTEGERLDSLSFPRPDHKGSPSRGAAALSVARQPRGLAVGRPARAAMSSTPREASADTTQRIDPTPADPLWRFICRRAAARRRERLERADAAFHEPAQTHLREFQPGGRFVRWRVL